MRSYAAGLSRHGAALWVLCGLAGSAWATDGSAPPAPEGLSSVDSLPDGADHALDFDIPAQPLGDALKRYGALTRQPALFRSEILAGLTSSAVRGLYAPEAALRLLLDGTGLVAEKVQTGSGVTLALKAASVQATAPRAASLGNLAGYPSLVQARVWEALCDNVRTRPGTYRSLLRLQVDAAGQVQRARLLGSTGDAFRDAAILGTLQSVRLERSPPPDMPQPLTLLILPTDSSGGTRCGSAMSSGAS